MRLPPVGAHKIGYLSRGKVHLVNPATLTEGYQKTDHARVWCGVRMEDTNNYTTNVADCTCQKCLMVNTKTWGGRERGKRNGK